MNRTCFQQKWTTTYEQGLDEQDSKPNISPVHHIARCILHLNLLPRDSSRKLILQSPVLGWSSLPPDPPPLSPLNSPQPPLRLHVWALPLLPSLPPRLHLPLVDLPFTETGLGIAAAFSAALHAPLSSSSSSAGRLDILPTLLQTYCFRFYLWSIGQWKLNVCDQIGALVHC